jgi:NitT/TauT family transport system permease protein
MSVSTGDKLPARSVSGSAQKRVASAYLPVRGELSTRSDALIGFTGVGVFIALWCVLTYAHLIRPFTLPTPTSIISTLIRLYNSGKLIMPIARSLWRVTQALLIVTAVGVPIGVLMGTFTPVDAFLRKLINGAKAVPVTGLTALVTLWMGLEEGGKILYIFLGAIFYMIILVKNAVAGVNEEYTKVALDLGANRRQIIGRVLFLGALPQIWDAMAVCNGIMWTYIVLAEFLNSNVTNRGLGGVLQDGQRLAEISQVYAVLIVIAVISSLTDFVFQFVRKKFLDW